MVIKSDSLVKLPADSRDGVLDMASAMNWRSPTVRRAAAIILASEMTDSDAASQLSALSDSDKRTPLTDQLHSRKHANPDNLIG